MYINIKKRKDNTKEKGQKKNSKQKIIITLEIGHHKHHQKLEVITGAPER